MPLAFEFECTPVHQYGAHVIIDTKAGLEKGRTLHSNSQSVLATPRGTSASRSRALHDLYYTMNSAAGTSTPRLWHLKRHVQDEDGRRTASKKEVCTCRFSKATSFRTLFSSSALALMVPTPSDAMTSPEERPSAEIESSRRLHQWSRADSRQGGVRCPGVALTCINSPGCFCTRIERVCNRLHVLSFDSHLQNAMTSSEERASAEIESSRRLRVLSVDSHLFCYC